jgi:hypothetical protein
MHKNSKGLDGTLDCVGELHRDGAMGGEFSRLKATKDEVLRVEGITWRPGVKARLVEMAFVAQIICKKSLEAYGRNGAGTQDEPLDGV